MTKIIINFSIFFSIYNIPLIVFVFYSLKNKVHKGLIILLSILYLLLSIITSGKLYNLFPFIIVVSNIILINKVHKGVFSFNGFRIFKALKYATFTYIISLAVSFVYMLILLQFNIKINDQQIITVMLDLPIIKFIMMMPIIIVFAPIVEEFVFRWILYDRFLKPYIGDYAGATLSSIAFAFVHYNLKSFAVILTLGYINCWLINNKGYWYAVLNHGFFNSISVIILLSDKLT